MSPSAVTYSATVRGFTLVELVTTLVLIGILAAFAAPRLDFGAFSQQAFQDELTNALRHAQKVALASGCPVQVKVGASGYSLGYTGTGGAACGSGEPLPHPTGGGPFQGSGDISSGGTVVFDAMGRTDSGLTIELGNGGQVIVETGSGYIHG